MVIVRIGTQLAKGGILAVMNNSSLHMWPPPASVYETSQHGKETSKAEVTSKRDDDVI